ncbi:MAG: tripartite tricarboxylate transporter substrate binding protein [Xanthobacteraceae bacterium]|nr:tripartite tricarboxylate transporter substrate binding protein [Xanthobacteraceae bacterium]
MSLIFLSPTAGAAQHWPAKQPIKIVVPFTAGSATDITARTVFEQVGKQIGQTFVVENRGGAGTTLGSGTVAKADPDGYTLLVNSTSHVVVASTYAKLPFSVTDDFVAVGGLADIPFVVTTPPRYKTLKDLIDAGKKPGSTILYGSAGAGSSGHLFMDLLCRTAGFPGSHVPFRGTPEGMTELIAGRLDVYGAPAVNAISLTRDGKISALAVSARQRLPLMPDVLTLAEAGLPAAEYVFWVGAFAPAKTPKPIVDRLNREIGAALAVKEVAEKITALGGVPMPMAPVEFDAFIRKELAVNANIVKASGYRPQ